MKLKLITEPRRSEIRTEVKQWMDAHGGSGFSSYKGVAASAVLEFLANREGLTFYGYMVDFTPSEELRK